MDKDKDKRSLYDEALARFRKDATERHASSKDAELLNEFLGERATPEETKQAAEVLQGDAGKKYGSRKVGDAEIPASWVANIMGNIEIFVAAGDFVTKEAPESVGMAWYAVKLTLTAIHSNYDLYTFFGTGLSDVSEIMIIVRHYDRLYDERTKPGWRPSPLVEKLFQDVISAYAAVLDFSFAIKRHLTAGALTRIKHGFKDFFGLSKAKFEDKLGAVAGLKQRILEESQGAFQDKTLAQLQSVSTVVAGIEGAVRHIQDFQVTQAKLHEDAMARFDALLKGLDDIRASTKRKTQWDYAVQDYQTFQESLHPLEGSFKVLGDTIDAVYPGTCQWVFGHRLYKQWAEAADNAELCITGPDGSGKSYVIATVADALTRTSEVDRAVLYVTCSGSNSATGPGNTQSFTADSICRTFLSQLYDLAVQGEDNVGLLEACNGVFRRAKAKNSSLPTHMRTEGGGLPEFAEGFCQLAALLKKRVVLILDGLDRSTIDDRSQGELLGKIQALMTAAASGKAFRLHILVGCASSTKFFNDLNLAPGSYIDVQQHNSQDIELLLKDALKDVPGLAAAEQETARVAILEKAGSRFRYVKETAIPFMREPFQRPLSKRLEELPDGTSDVYAQALARMSPNYLDLLRTALTWTLLVPGYPGFPFAREIMDAFQGTYDVPPKTDAEDDSDVEAGFPRTSGLELEQLRAATDPFLMLYPKPDGNVQVYESDAMAVMEYFMKPAPDVSEEHDDCKQLCVRCGSSREPVTPVYVDPREGHLQMALTCLRHLNNPLFQRRAGLVGAAAEEKKDGDSEESSDSEDATPDGDGHGKDAERQTDGATGDTPAPDDKPSGMEDPLKQVEDGYATETSLDDEDITEPQLFEDDSFKLTDDKDDDEGFYKTAARVRYELQYWPWHVRQAEGWWPAEQREDHSDWVALMSELDKFAFDTPKVFAAWQAKFPDQIKDDEGYDVPGFLALGQTQRPLHVAAYLGASSWVRHLVARGEDVNALSEGFSPLQAAACSGGPIETIELLLEQGAEVNAENGAGRTAFHFWLMRNEITVEGVRLLLEHGADPRISCSRFHWNALHYFALRGDDPEVLDLLLTHGVDINAVHPNDVWQRPPLHLLLGRREVPGPLLEAFIKHGADTNSEDASSARPLQMVCTSGQLANLEILLQSEVLELDDTDFHGTTAVHEAAFFGHSKCVAALLARGADPDVTDKLNRTALHTAARRGLVEVVRVLLQYTKQVNLLDKHGWSPLFCACLGKSQEAAAIILNALIEHNIPLADISKPTRSNRTVLRQAADRGFTAIVTKLIELASPSSSPPNSTPLPNPDPNPNLHLNLPDSLKGLTPLHRAAQQGHLPIVTALLTAGADPSPPSHLSRPPLTLAHERYALSNAATAPSYESIISQLIAASPATAIADTDLPCVCAAMGSLQLLRKLWDLGGRLNRPDQFGWTPLEVARRFNRREVVAFLERQAVAGAGLVPERWARGFPGATGVGARSVSDGDGTRVVHTSGRRVAVSAERPVPRGLERYYFEVTLETVPVGAGGGGGGGAGLGGGAGREKTPEWPEMAIGFCTLGGAALDFPGWWPGTDTPTLARSWAYHSDTGGVYSSVDDPGDNFVDVLYEKWRYHVGDTVGCGVDLRKGEIWFTKNGVKLDRVVKGVEGRLFPVVGLHEEVCFETNFGTGSEPGFKWKPEKGKAEDEKEKDGGAVKIVVVDGKADDEKRAIVQVTSKEVVVQTP